MVMDRVVIDSKKPDKRIIVFSSLLFVNSTLSVGNRSIETAVVRMLEDAGEDMVIYIPAFHDTPEMIQAEIHVSEKMIDYVIKDFSRQKMRIIFDFEAEKTFSGTCYIEDDGKQRRFKMTDYQFLAYYGQG
jgi:hypothetical protein